MSHVGTVWCHSSVCARTSMPLFVANVTSASAGAKFGVAAGIGGLLPAAFGHTVSGFIAFSAVIALKCFLSSVAAAPVVESASMAAPTGKPVTPKRAAMTVLSAGAVDGSGITGPPLLLELDELELDELELLELPLELLALLP